MSEQEVISKLKRITKLKKSTISREDPFRKMLMCSFTRPVTATSRLLTENTTPMNQEKICDLSKIHEGKHLRQSFKVQRRPSSALKSRRSNMNVSINSHAISQDNFSSSFNMGELKIPLRPFINRRKSSR